MDLLYFCILNFCVVRFNSSIVYRAYVVLRTNRPIIQIHYDAIFDSDLEFCRSNTSPGEYSVFPFLVILTME
jgi:hypothetical protein